MITSTTAEGYAKDVLTVSPEALVPEAATLMAREAMGCLVVVDARRRVVGVLTDRDLALRVVGSDREPTSVRVSEVMTPDPLTMPLTSPLEEVVNGMRVRGVRRVPLLDGEQLAGLVSLDDLISHLARMLEDLGEGLRLQYGRARKDARYEHVREDLDRHAEMIRNRLEYAGWYARESFLDELDEIRKRVRKTLGFPEE